MKRRKVDEAVEQGAPLVVYWYGGGQLDWNTEREARERWSSLRRAFTTQDPLPGRDVVWTGGFWVSEDESPMIVLEGHC